MKESPAEATHYSNPQPVWSTQEFSISFIQHLKSEWIYVYTYIPCNYILLYEYFIILPYTFPVLHGGIYFVNAGLRWFEVIVDLI